MADGRTSAYRYHHPNSLLKGNRRISGVQDIKKSIADAGYESEENYVFLDTNQQLAFIKPSNYEISKKRKYKNDIGRIENMDYDEKK